MRVVREGEHPLDECEIELADQVGTLGGDAAEGAVAKEKVVPGLIWLVAVAVQEVLRVLGRLASLYDPPLRLRR